MATVGDSYSTLNLARIAAGTSGALGIVDRTKGALGLNLANTLGTRGFGIAAASRLPKTFSALESANFWTNSARRIALDRVIQNTRVTTDIASRALANSGIMDANARRAGTSKNFDIIGGHLTNILESSGYIGITESSRVAVRGAASALATDPFAGTALGAALSRVGPLEPFSGMNLAGAAGFGKMSPHVYRDTTSMIAQAVSRDFLRLGSIADEISATLSRQQAFVTVGELRALASRAHRIRPEEADVSEVLMEALTRIPATDGPPLEHELLIDDPALVHAWITSLAIRIKEALGLNDRDLQDDAWATYVYTLSASLTLVLLLKFPTAAAVVDLLGGVTAHGAGILGARVSRKVYRGIRLDGPDR